MSDKTVYSINLGLCDFQYTLKIQEMLFNKLISLKTNKQSHRNNSNGVHPTGYLLLCEHYPVYTIGRGAKFDVNKIQQSGDNKNFIPIHQVNRGGKITFHNPGQLIVYPILDLEYYDRDINKYLRSLENVVIKSLFDFNIHSKIFNNHTGVWVANEGTLTTTKKICSIGIKLKKWVTMHGLALNVNNDLQCFNNFIPCGINNVSMTSMKSILAKKVAMSKVAHSIEKTLSNIFNCKVVRMKNNRGRENTSSYISLP